MATDIEIAWAAGLFEGEGCIFVSRHRIPGQPRLEMRMTDKDVLERFAKIVGYGKVQSRTYDQAPNSVKRVYKWGVYDCGGVRDILEVFMPYFGRRRRAKAKEVLRLTKNMKARREVYIHH